MSFSDACASSAPSNRIDPPVTCPPLGSSCITDHAVCVLPEPDSPISPCTSPRRTVSDTSCTTSFTDPSGWS